MTDKKTHVIAEKLNQYTVSGFISLYLYKYNYIHFWRHIGRRELGNSFVHLYGSDCLRNNLGFGEYLLL